MKKLIFLVLALGAPCLYGAAPETLWTKTYGGSSSDQGQAIQLTSDNGYIVTGYTESSGAGGADLYLLKLDVNGDTSWSKTS